MSLVYLENDGNVHNSYENLQTVAKLYVEVNL